MRVDDKCGWCPPGFCVAWWRHQMETFSALLAIYAGYSPVPGEFPAQRPVTQSFDVFLGLHLNKRLNKQSSGWWFETLSHPLWRHSNGFTSLNQWNNSITHRDRHKMTANSQTTFSNAFLNENVRISLKVSLKFVPDVPIDNIPVLVRRMAWRRPGDKPLSEPMMVRLRIYALLGLNELRWHCSLNGGDLCNSQNQCLPR